MALKTISGVSLGGLQEQIAVLDKPECWGMRCISWDYTLKRWPSRESLARSIRMQQKRESRRDDWKPIVKLTDGEGY